jgi:hypothetical protein
VLLLLLLLKVNLKLLLLLPVLQDCVQGVRPLHAVVVRQVRVPVCGAEPVDPGLCDTEVVKDKEPCSNNHSHSSRDTGGGRCNRRSSSRKQGRRM